MLRTLNPFLKKTSLDKCEKPRKPVVVQTTYVYRDELDTTKKPPSQNKIKKKVRFDLDQQRGESEESVKKNNSGGGFDLDQQRREREESVKKNKSGGGGGVKVKILMTKEEAVRLLSRCKDGGVLAFKDVAHEIIDIPLSRVAVISRDDAVDDTELN